MKLSLTQLEQHLTKQLSPIYIISGDELLLKHDAMQWIRKAGKKANIEKTRYTPGINFAWDDLYTLLYSTSLLDEKRLLEFDFRDNLPNKTASLILAEYANNPSPYHIVVMDIGKVDDKIAKSAWYVALEKAGVAVACWPVTHEQLPQWILHRAKKYKLQISQEATHLLADYVEGNLVAAAQAIEKMYLLKPENIIDIHLIQTILADESHYTIFDFIENLIAKDMARTLHILNHLEAEGTEPTLILWSITRELRLLIELAQSFKQGESYDILFKKYRIFPRRHASVRHFLTTFSKDECFHHLMHAEELDKIVKGAVPGNIWDSLQLFCLRLMTHHS